MERIAEYDSIVSSLTEEWEKIISYIYIIYQAKASSKIRLTALILLFSYIAITFFENIRIELQ